MTNPTTYKVFKADGSVIAGQVEWPRDPGYDRIAAVVDPFLEGGDLERVAVLHEGKATDMFVDDCSLIKRLPINKAASAIYRNNAMTKNPRLDPESLPPIYGTAILFDRPVWF